MVLGTAIVGLRKEKTMVKKQLVIWNLNDLKTIMYEINNIEILCKKKPHISKVIFSIFLLSFVQKLIIFLNCVCNFFQLIKVFVFKGNCS